MDKARLAKLMEKFPCKQLPNGNIRTCPVRLDYVHLFAPHVSKKFEGQGQKPKYSTSILFPKGADLEVIKDAMKAEAAETFGAKWAQQKVKLRLLDQGEEGSRDENGNLAKGYVEGAKMLRCTSGKAPAVKFRDKHTDAEPEQAYSGVWAIVTLKPHGSEYGAKQVTCMLQNVILIADDEKMFEGGGSSDPNEDFDDIDANDDAALLDEEAGEEESMFG